MSCFILFFIVLMNPLCYYVTNTYTNFWTKIIGLPHTIFTTYICWKYPFLRFDHKPYDYDEEESNFIQDISWYDTMQKGWAKAFGLKLCKELNDIIKNTGDDIYFTDIKEKWGHIDISYIGGNELTDNVVFKYQDISEEICKVCGKKAKYISDGWICPYCKKHIGNRKILEILE